MKKRKLPKSNKNEKSEIPAPKSKRQKLNSQQNSNKKQKKGKQDEQGIYHPKMILRAQRQHKLFKNHKRERAKILRKVEDNKNRFLRRTGIDKTAGLSEEIIKEREDVLPRTLFIGYFSPFLFSSFPCP